MHARSAPHRLGVPPALRELLKHRTGIEVRRCSQCGLRAAWAETFESRRLVMLARLEPDGWVRGKLQGACPAGAKASACK